jgi:pimeloyl-ACP methyl ester carboxylesterase
MSRSCALALANLGQAAASNEDPVEATRRLGTLSEPVKCLPCTNPKTDFRAICGGFGDTLAIVFRPSYFADSIWPASIFSSFLCWIYNFVPVLERQDFAGRHPGFVQALEELWPAIEEEVAQAVSSARDEGHGHAKVTLVGHSLGGALATLAADRLTNEAEIKHDLRGAEVSGVCTFGAPRAGDFAFEESYPCHSVHHRFEIDGDLVPELPLGPLRPQWIVDYATELGINLTPAITGVFHHVGHLHLLRAGGASNSFAPRDPQQLEYPLPTREKGDLIELLGNHKISKYIELLCARTDPFTVDRAIGFRL